MFIDLLGGLDEHRVGPLGVVVVPWYDDAQLPNGSIRCSARWRRRRDVGRAGARSRNGGAARPP